MAWLSPSQIPPAGAQPGLVLRPAGLWGPPHHPAGVRPEARPRGLPAGPHPETPPTSGGTCCTAPGDTRPGTGPGPCRWRWPRRPQMRSQTCRRKQNVLGGCASMTFRGAEGQSGGLETGLSVTEPAPYRGWGRVSRGSSDAGLGDRAGPGHLLGDHLLYLRLHVAIHCFSCGESGVRATTRGRPVGHPGLARGTHAICSWPYRRRVC